MARVESISLSQPCFSSAAAPQNLDSTLLQPLSRRRRHHHHHFLETVLQILPEHNRRFHQKEEEKMSWSLHLPLNNPHSAAARCSRTLKPANYCAAPTACLNVDVRAPDADRIPPLQGKRSSEIIADEKKFIVGTYARAPVVLASGKGCKLYDVEGREYLDLTSGIAVNALGHGDSDWLRAVAEQAEVLAHVSNVYYSVPQVKGFYITVLLFSPFPLFCCMIVLLITYCLLSVDNESLITELYRRLCKLAM